MYFFLYFPLRMFNHVFLSELLSLTPGSLNFLLASSLFLPSLSVGFCPFPSIFPLSSSHCLTIDLSPMFFPVHLSLSSAVFSIYWSLMISLFTFPFSSFHPLSITIFCYPFFLHLSFFVSSFSSLIPTSLLLK